MHNPMFDGQGRVWMTARVRPPADAGLLQGRDPLTRRRSCFRSTTSVRQAAIYDPKTKTAHAHQHLLRHASPDVRGGRQQHALVQRLRQSSSSAGSTRRCSTRRTTRRSRRGGHALILDTNGNGKRDAYVEAGSADRSRRRTSGSTMRSTRVNPAPDGSMWGSVLGFPGAIIRLVPGPNPTETAIAERYELPWLNPNAPIKGIRRAAWTSIATASPGSRSGAAISPASIAASATAR